MQAEGSVLRRVASFHTARDLFAMSLKSAPFLNVVLQRSVCARFGQMSHQEVAALLP